MEHRYSIGQLAQAASVATSTVRYYERINLLTPRSRTDANYRVYGEESLQRLHFIRAAQAHGFTLEDVKLLLSFRDGKTTACKEVQVLIEERLVDLEKRIMQLHHLQEILRASLKICRRSRRPADCHVIDKLQSTTPGGPPNADPGRRSRTSRQDSRT